MKKFSVTGMSCAACSARVERAVSKLEGVESVSVSLLTNSMGVEGSASAEEIIKAVEEAGYGASLIGGNDTASAGGSSSAGSASRAGSSSVSALEASLKDVETPRLLKRLCWSVGFVLVLMYFSMGHMMWKWPVPAFFEENFLALGILQMLLSSIIMVINQKFFINGFKGLVKGSPNMDTLVALGSSASFGWSVYVLFAMTSAQMKGDASQVHDLMHQFYFESAAMILALITVGKTLEAYSKGKTTDALKSLVKLSPDTACVLRDGEEVTVAVDQVAVGDVFLVRPGESIPVDGQVLEGVSAVNESALTGESVPVDKEPGSTVSAGTMNASGFLKCKAVHVGSDTALSKIIQLVSDAAATKAPIAKIADRVSGVFVPVVISIAVVVTAIWLFLGAQMGFALARGISVLVISCPCALGLATPVAIMVGNGVGARNGILFKTSASLEETGKCKFVVLDKTGTVTEGKPVVTDVVVCAGGDSSLNSGDIPCGSVDSSCNSGDNPLDSGDNPHVKELLELAVCVERMSEHPLAKAVVSYGDTSGLGESGWTCEKFEALPGNGVAATVCQNAGDGSNNEPDVEKKLRVYGGSRVFVSKKAALSKELEAACDRVSAEGKTPLLFAAESVGEKCCSSGATLLGMIAVADTIKADSALAVEELKKLGLEVFMLTGDNEKTAKAVASQAGIENVIANVLPQDKENAVRNLQENGKVIMVGDGINDAPALTRADIGMAIGSGTDVAMDAADVVLMHSSLRDVACAIRLSRKTLLNIKENLFWAFIYNVVGIPLAAGAFISLFGWEMNPMYGAAAMSLSSFCVVSNALRLNLAKIRNKVDGDLRTGAEGTAPQQKVTFVRVNATKEIKMTKTIKIEGMMCHHCEGHVKTALEAIDGVTEAVPSHESKTAVVTLSKDVDNALLTKAVEDAGYKVLGVE